MNLTNYMTISTIQLSIFKHSNLAYSMLNFLRHMNPQPLLKAHSISPLKEPVKKRITFSKKALKPQGIFSCLNNSDVITAQISDHHPVIHNGVLFWNVMMQCKARLGGKGFNNGFSLIETDKAYKTRLQKVAFVIAEIIYREKNIDCICLCEGPIQSKHVDVLYNTLMLFPFMKRFMTENKFYHPEEKGDNWGLMMLVALHFKVEKVQNKFEKTDDKLINRLQLWSLESRLEKKYIALAHFPFAGNEHLVDFKNLSASGKEYCLLIQKLLEEYNDKNFVFCADFNFNPYLIKEYKENVLNNITPNNSIVLVNDKYTQKNIVKTVTVDGVLLSQQAKQKYHVLYKEVGLFGKLKLENDFSKSCLEDSKLEIAKV